MLEFLADFERKVMPIDGSSLIPEYRGLKKRCDFCNKDFHRKELLAACSMKIEGAKKPYVMIFCFKGDGDIRDQHCLHSWCADYQMEEESVPAFEVMKYLGSGRGRGNTGRYPVPI